MNFFLLLLCRACIFFHAFVLTIFSSRCFLSLVLLSNEVFRIIPVICFQRYIKYISVKSESGLGRLGLARSSARYSRLEVRGDPPRLISAWLEALLGTVQASAEPRADARPPWIGSWLGSGLGTRVGLFKAWIDSSTRGSAKCSFRAQIVLARRSAHLTGSERGLGLGWS